MRRCLMIGLTAALLENALVTRQGAWVLLAVCPNTEEARAAFEDSFTRTEVRPSPTPRPIPTPDELGRIPCDPPGTADMTVYDTGPVVEAYRTGDGSDLSQEDRAILELRKPRLRGVFRRRGFSALLQNEGRGAIAPRPSV